jgi:hypothetical protein
MADLDVSELLLDIDFVDAMSLVHRTSTVNSKGENVLVETTVSTFGSIQPISGKELHRIPEALRQSDIRTFYIKAEITTDGTGRYPDILIFKSKRFQVISTSPWLNFGEGWNEGLCVVESPS